MQKDARPAPAAGKRPEDTTAPAHGRPRYLDPDLPRRAPLGRLRTEEEARLAAEIDKLGE